MKEFDSLLANYESNMAEHVMTVVAETDAVKCYRFGKPDTRVYSFQVTETPEALHICGDVPSEPLTACKSFAWFLDASSPDYLAEKFRIEKVWDWESAREDLLAESEGITRDAGYNERVAFAEKLIEVAEDLGPPDHEAIGAFALCDALNDIGYETGDGIPGYRLPPERMAMIEAIRRTCVRCIVGDTF